MAKSNPLKLRPKRFRAGAARGLKSSAPAVDREAGDWGAGLIRGAAVVTRGEALGHGYWLDREFLQQTAAGINRRRIQGVKTRFTHPSLSGDGLGSFLGRAKNARVDGDVVRADVHFSRTAHDTPDGDLAAYVMDLAEEDPESFGISIVYFPDYGAEDKHYSEHEDEKGRFKSPDPANEQNLPHARIAQLRAADVVDDPAANPDGLFHRGQAIASEADALLSYSLGLGDRPAELVTFDIDQDRAKQFVRRFLDNHNLTIVPKGEAMAESSQLNEDPKPVETQPEQKPADKSAETAPGAKPEQKPVEPAAPQQAQKTGKDYLEAFGQQGAVWFVEGKSWDEAQRAYAENLKRENEELKTKLAAANRGEAEPLSEQPSSEKPRKQATGRAGKLSDDELAERKAHFQSRMGKNLGALAAEIVLPGR